MSLLDQQVSLAPGVYFDFVGGGGGGGGGSNITVSTITGLSSIITGAGGFLDISGSLNIFTKGFPNSNAGFEVYAGGGNTTNALADFDAGSGGQGAIGVRGYSTISGTQTIDSFMTMSVDTTRNGLIRLQHEWAGLSTMSQIAMNADGSLQLTALPPASGGAGTSINLEATRSTIVFQPQGVEAAHFRLPVSTNTYVPQAGTAQNLGAFTSIVGNAYDIRLPVRIDAVSAPSAGDWSLITTDTATAPTALGTFDMTSVNATGNQWETHLCGTIVASGTTTTIQALGKPVAGTSTAVTVAGSAAYIRNLGVPQAQ